jgi:hypothetical protein
VSGVLKKNCCGDFDLYFGMGNWFINMKLSDIHFFSLVLQSYGGICFWKNLLLLEANRTKLKLVHFKSSLQSTLNPSRAMPVPLQGIPKGRRGS